MLLLIVMCSAICYMSATAQAQELFSPNFTPGAAGITSGRWSLETPAAATAPQLPVSMLDPQVRPSHSIPSSTAQPNNNRSSTPIDNRVVNLGRLQINSGTPDANSGPVVFDDTLHPESFLSFVRTKYVLQEPRLADSQSLTRVNAVSALPLLRINYAGWNLPVTLYNRPSRTSDARW